MPAKDAAQEAHRIHAFRALSGRPCETDALALLHRLAAHAHPIMRKKQWRVERLEEFSPPNAGLLGMNHNSGELIQIRLRPAGNDGAFLPWEELMGTLLHELVHIERGPHDATFYRMLDELWDEYERNVDSGKIDADATATFTGPGRAVGGKGKRAAPPKVLAAAAARARQRRAALGLHGAHRLGGLGRPAAGKTPGEMAAEAAERRRRDAIACGNVDHAGQAPGRPTAPTAAEAPAEAPAADDARKRARPDPPAAAGWACAACTFINEQMWLQCDVCGTARKL